MTSTTHSISQEFQLQIKKETQRERIIKIAPMIVLLALVIFFSVSAQGFMSVQNFLTLITQMAIPLIIACGLTFVVLLGSIDLSIDGVMGLCGSAIGMIVLNNKTSLALGLWGLPIMMALGGGIGLLTGVIHVKGKIPSFMVSYGMLSVTSGLAIISYSAIPPTILDESIRGFSLTKVAGLPLFVYVSAGIFFVALFIQNKTAFGKYIFAIGENEAFVKVSGVNVDRIKILVFVWSGILVGIAGVMGAAQIGRGDVAVGNGQTFPALAAVVLGGTSLSGGKGGIISTLLGTLTITVLNNGLVLLGVNPYIKDAVMGVILISAVILTLNRNPKQVTK